MSKTRDSQQVDYFDCIAEAPVMSALGGVAAPYGNMAKCQDLLPVSKPPETPSVEEYIKLVEEVEATHPGYRAEDTLQSLRMTAGYDDENFDTMLGGLGEKLEPSGSLTKQDIQRLRTMSGHGFDASGFETGIVRDASGQDVAMGHTITGMLAGMNRDDNLYPAPGGKSIGNLVGLGDNVDNLYAATLAGDLGQTAYDVWKHPDATLQGGKFAYVGDGTEEATDAELAGDIDGLRVGEALYNQSFPEPFDGTNFTPAPTASDMLKAYYLPDNQKKTSNKGQDGSDPTANTTFANRFQYADQSIDKAYLKNQTSDFLNNWDHKNKGLTRELFGTLPFGISNANDDKQSHAEGAVNEFSSWAHQKATDEASQ